MKVTRDVYLYSYRATRLCLTILFQSKSNALRLNSDKSNRDSPYAMILKDAARPNQSMRQIKDRASVPMHAQQLNKELQD